MKPGGSMPHTQELSNIPILNRITPIPRSDTYFFKIHFNISLPRSHLPVSLPVETFKALLLSFILATCPTHVKFLTLIALIILGEPYKLILKLSLFLILVPFGPRYSPQDPDFKYPCPLFAF